MPLVLGIVGWFIADGIGFLLGIIIGLLILLGSD